MNTIPQQLETAVSLQYQTINYKGGMQSMHGRVIKFFHDREYGFIRGEDNNTYFIHHSKLNGEFVDSGFYVYFKPFQNDRSDYNAKNVIMIEVAERRRKHGKTRK